MFSCLAELVPQSTEGMDALNRALQQSIEQAPKNSDVALFLATVKLEANKRFHACRQEINADVRC